MEERKGFLTPEQEAQLDELIKVDNIILEKLDGVGIRLFDNQVLERAKAKIIELNPAVLPIVYEVIDTIFAGLAEIAPK
jgi:hypothetical protein